MKILAIEQETPGTTAEQFQPHLKAEAAHAWGLYKSNIIREIYFDAIRHVAVIVLECESLDAAREILDTLPLVQNGLISFDLYVLEPYSAFSRLFEV